MKLIYRFFVVLGVIFFCLLIGLGYFIVADPFNLRPLVASMYEISAMPENDNAATSSTTRTEATEGGSAGTTNLSESQAQALEAVGINAGAVPDQFTPEQTTCFVGILGQARVDAIIAGATPTPAEFFQAKDCL